MSMCKSGVCVLMCLCVSIISQLAGTMCCKAVCLCVCACMHLYIRVGQGNDADNITL